MFQDRGRANLRRMNEEVGSRASLLEQTLAAATRQEQSVTFEGKRTAGMLEGVSRRSVPTQVDDRGFLVELFNPSWEWFTEPFAYAYATTVRPGYVKGWGMHKEHTDRYFLLLGEIEVVLYDVRPDSRTCGQISVVRMSEYDRGLLNIPELVWHALRNLGSTDAVVVNFPTVAFDHENPDKYGLPLNTPVIPYSFEGLRGW
jgi:dTDP-4-dehydrorhamnose 3,5-epimerase